jgi:hypothetical protein
VKGEVVWNSAAWELLEIIFLLAGYVKETAEENSFTLESEAVSLGE